jgi:hypothetical protein
VIEDYGSDLQNGKSGCDFIMEGEEEKKSSGRELKVTKLHRCRSGEKSQIRQVTSRSLRPGAREAIPGLHANLVLETGIL